MKFNIYLWLISAFALTLKVEAATFLWDNQEGFVPVESCQLSTLKSGHFTLTRQEANESRSLSWYNEEGQAIGPFPSWAIVLSINPDNQQNYRQVRILSQADGNSLYDRNSEGRVASDSFEEWTHRVVLLSKIRVAVPTLEGGKNEAYIAPLSRDGELHQLNCPSQDGQRQFQAFAVFSDPDLQTPIAILGVSRQETEIFSYGKSTDIQLDSGQLTAIYEGSLPLLSEMPIGDIKTLVPSSSELREDQSLTAEGLQALKQELANQKTINPQQTVICTKSGLLNVRSDNLEKVLFKARLGENANPYQSWDQPDRQEKEINGKLYTFIHVQFSEREEKDQLRGWVAEEFVKKAENCPYLPTEKEDPKTGPFTGLDDPRCCKFPTLKAPTHSFTSGAPRFAAGRSNNRLHAACDLYRYKDEAMLSVAPGVVTRGLYYFYQGTYALEVKHDGGFIVRYGEVTGKSPSGTSKGSRLKMGQTLGYIAKVNSNCCNPMLHFELYKGNVTGPLSQSGNRYQRRSDLMNPTDYLLSWMKK